MSRSTKMYDPTKPSRLNTLILIGAVAALFIIVMIKSADLERLILQHKSISEDNRVLTAFALNQSAAAKALTERAVDLQQYNADLALTVIKQHDDLFRNQSTILKSLLEGQQSIEHQLTAYNVSISESVNEGKP